ncbi:MAG TPA: hypothetical protein VJB58_01125 [Candidatus Paceibacterota bacterium]
MVVGESSMCKTLETVLKATMPETVRVSREGSLSGLLEHEPTHVIWDWRDKGYSPDESVWDKEWEVFLTNAQILAVKVMFLSVLPASNLPEPVQSFILRMPISVNDILSNLQKGDE